MGWSAFRSSAASRGESGYPGHAGPTLLGTLAISLVAVHLEPDSLRRAEAGYAWVLGLGWGHLLGPVWLARGNEWRRWRSAGAAGLRALRLATGAILLFAVYVVVVRASVDQAPALQRFLFIALLAASLWHIVENEWALARVLRLGATMPARLAAPLRCGLLALGMAAAGALLPDARRDGRGPSLPDLFLASTLYHLLSWLAFHLRRAWREGRLASACRLLLGLHLPPLVLTALLWRDGGALAPAQALFFSPVFYGFCSLLHVVQTVRARRLRVALEPSKVPS